MTIEEININEVFTKDVRHPYEINPYVGCMHNCVYCYVPTKLNLKRQYIVKKNIPKLLEKVLEINKNILSVFFSYDKESFTLKNINFQVKIGQVIAIVGESGSGKTTLINLIPRFYDPKQGAIYMDNHNIRNIGTENLRKQIGIISQEIFLFNTTIKENISLGRTEVTDKMIYNASKISNAHKFIENLPLKYETIIGERGMKLSGGQKQRIAIARAILIDPKVLIFDEALSELDPIAEESIYNSCISKIKDKIVFIVTHNFKIISIVDEIFVLNNGELKEKGKHNELMKNNSIYKNLYEKSLAKQKL